MRIRSIMTLLIVVVTTIATMTGCQVAPATESTVVTSEQQSAIEVEETAKTATAAEIVETAEPTVATETAETAEPTVATETAETAEPTVATETAETAEPAVSAETAKTATVAEIAETAELATRERPAYILCGDKTVNAFFKDGILYFEIGGFESPEKLKEEYYFKEGEEIRKTELPKSHSAAVSIFLMRADKAK